MLSVTKSRLAGKIVIYLIMILALFISCKEVKEETQVPQKIVPKENINKISNTDSVTANDFGEHKSIHQTEWEEHRRERGLDTLRIDVNP